MKRIARITIIVGAAVLLLFSCLTEPVVQEPGNNTEDNSQSDKEEDLGEDLSDDSNIPKPPFTEDKKYLGDWNDYPEWFSSSAWEVVKVEKTEADGSVTMSPSTEIIPSDFSFTDSFVGNPYSEPRFFLHGYAKIETDGNWHFSGRYPEKGDTYIEDSRSIVKSSETECIFTVTTNNVTPGKTETLKTKNYLKKVTN